MSGLLKFITCGSVDDGKSTLIGHILYDTKMLYTDQEKALELDSRIGSRGGRIDYSLLLDGLIAEREQGITIDVAYRYFSTDRRSFIVADTPGHEEYTRNMAVGASFASLAVILVDATKGVLVQTRRHARICALMGIHCFVFAVNKMDLAGYAREPYEAICRQIQELARELSLHSVTMIPLSATSGENVTKKSEIMDWYEGESLLEYLESVEIEEETLGEGFCLPVQRVCRPDHTFRGFQGQIEAGRVCVGEELLVLPGGNRAGVRSILVGDQSAKEAFAGQAVTLELDREIDVSRGDVLCREAGLQVTSCFEASLLWMDDQVLARSRDMFVKLGTRLIPGRIAEILYTVDVNTGRHYRNTSLQKNEIARCVIELTSPITADTFIRHPALGELILIDRVTHATSACGVIERIYEAGLQTGGEISPQVRAKYMGQIPFLVLADDDRRAGEMELELLAQGLHTMRVRVGGDRMLFAADLLRRAGLITVISGEYLDPETEKQLRQALQHEQILDLRTGGPEEDRLIYENTVNYTFS